MTVLSFVPTTVMVRSDPTIRCSKNTRMRTRDKVSSALSLRVASTSRPSCTPSDRLDEGRCACLSALQESEGLVIGIQRGGRGRKKLELARCPARTKLPADGRRSSQVVRQGSAKASFVGSIPTSASSSKLQFGNGLDRAGEESPAEAPANRTRTALFA